MPRCSAIVLSGYQITEQLYTGTRTLVYRAIREADQQPVVIKLLRNEHPSFSELVQFRNQYTIAKNLEIPGIIKPYSLEPYHNGYALIMEDFGGMALSQYIREERGQTRLPLGDFLAIALQLCDILQDFYQHRVIHKDIKPANILIHAATKQVKLIDFSIASLLPRETPAIQSPNLLEGTLAYLSPEQTGRMNRGIDYRSDFYALGATFYELLTGHIPFVVTDPLEMIHCHIAKHPPAAHNLNPDIPPALSAIVSKLMAKNAESRYQSTFGLKHDLERCLEQWQQGRLEPFEAGQRDLCDRFLIPERLYGRETEVQLLLDAFERVSGSGEAKTHPTPNAQSELMLIAGFSGIGKTAVVNEVHKPIVRQRGYFIKGKFDQFQRNIPLAAFVQAFRDLMGQLLSESDAQLQQWQTQILAAVGENGQVIIDVVPELEHIIGSQPPVSALAGSAAQNRFERLLQQFIQVFTTPDHPLVIFIDDLQWADAASLNLMRSLMSEATRHLLLIGAYRDNEVTLAHPLMLSLKEIQAVATVQTITLAPLSQPSVNQLVADTLSCSLALAAPLTALLMDKTGGNPFFTTQFLKVLYDDRLVTFNTNENYWECDLAQVRSLALTDDVVEFMATQLQKLPAPTQAILKLAACIGHQFDLHTLAIVSEQSEAATAADLWNALQEGLIVPQSEIYKFYQPDPSSFSPQPSALIPRPCSYRFLHDRVQQAADSLMAETQKQQTHLTIGRLLLQNQSEPEHLFEILSHFNTSTALITDPLERRSLVQLNLAGCQRAKAATAYRAAAQYASVAMSLLPLDAWQTDYALSLQLYDAAADVAYLNTEFAEAEALIQTVWQYAKQTVDCIKSYERLVQIYIAKDQQLQAIETGLEALIKLGVPLIERTNWQDLPPLPDASDLNSKPTMTQPEYLAALQILITITPPTHHVKPDLFPAVVLTMIDLCDRAGYSGLAAYAYGSYGLFLYAVVGDLEAAHRSGQVSLTLLEQYQARELRTKVNMLFAVFVSACKEPGQATFPLLEQGIEVGLEVGDAEHVSYCIMAYLSHLFLLGQPLALVEQCQQNYLPLLEQFKQEHCIEYAKIWLRVTAEFTELEPVDNITEATILERFESTHNHQCLFAFHLAKLISCYTFGHYAIAVDHAARAIENQAAAFGILLTSAHTFYHSLALLGLITTQPTQQETVLEQVASNQLKLQHLADHAPSNYQHKFALISAEIQRIRGQKSDAIDFYDRAIALANEYGYLNEAAIANELAAKFYLAWGKERLAQAYLIDAYYGYARWGAKAKVIDLEARYPQLLATVLQQDSLCASETIAATHSLASHTSTYQLSTANSVSAALDLETVLKAFQSLSSEIQLETLLTTLLTIVLENAGADACTLLLLKADQLLVEATAVLDQPSIVLQALPLDDAQTVPIALINRVKHTLQTVISSNVTQDAGLMADPYILRQQPQSVLCTPLLYQGKLLGILYLENKLTLGAFTRDRVKLLNLLCAQAAISLENARLYQQSQQALASLSTISARFQRMTDNIPGIVYQFKVAPDGSASTPYMSPGCIALLEVSPEAFMTGAKDFRDMEHPDDRHAIEQAAVQATQTLTPFEQESRIITASGQVKWIQTNCRPERQADGTILWDGLKIDITDRIQAERQVKESQQFLQLLLDNIPQLVFWKNRDSVFQGCNAVAVKRWGLESSAALVGKTDYNFSFTLEEAAWYQECDRRVMDSGQAELHIIETQQQADGSQAWLDTCKIPLRDPDGQVIGLLVTIEDITEARRAEAIRIQAEAALQEQEQFLRSIYDGAEIIIFVVDVLEDGSFAYAGWNAAAERVAGRSSAAIAGKTLTEVWGEQQGKVLRQQFTRCLSTSTSLCFEECLTFDGQETWWFANLNPLKNTAGQIHRLIGTTFDISDRKRAETQLNQRTAELEQTLQTLQRTQTQMVQSEKMSGLGQLVAGVAHEINNPVNFIYGNLNHAASYTQDVLRLLQLYQQHYPTPHADIQAEIDAIDLEFLTEDLQKLLVSMKVGADRIQKIVASLRNFSRMDEADMKEVNIHDGIDSTLMILQHRLKARSDFPNIKVIKAYGSLPLIECYAGQLNQVFMNLLSNAIDALDESLGKGKKKQTELVPTPTITIQTALLDQQVVIQITDNGVGIPDRVKQRLFDPFFTTKPVGKGTGMGLSISYQIVTEKHRGTLECVSAPGEGATFIVTIPMRQAS